MFPVVIVFLLSYLLGSIPTAYIYGKMKGKDIRKEGSGNVGATNAGRVFGKKAFFLIFSLDFLKGFLPVFVLVPLFFKESSLREIISVSTLLVAIVGHVWSCFLKFKGGKGVATSLGGLCAIMPLASLLSIFVFAIVFFVTRTVSMGSIFAALSLPLFSWILKGSNTLTVFAIIISVLIIFSHRSNISRILSGTELKIR